MKKFFSIMLTIAIMLTMAGNVFASTLTPPSVVIPTNTSLGTISGTILGLIQWFGYILAIGMLLFIAIKYLMSSANEKADLKKGLIGYVIGAALLFSASTIVGILQDVFKF